MTFSVELDREDDGRWLAEVPAWAGVMCYGATWPAAKARRVLTSLAKIGWQIKRHSGSPRTLARIAKRTA